MAILLKELERIYSGEHKGIEVFKLHGTDEAHYRGNFHGDSLRMVYESEIKPTDAVLSYELMDKDRYMQTILANSCIEDLWIDEEGFPVMVVILKDDE